MNKEKLKKLAREFLDKCDVYPMVYAKEGGVEDLDSILADFVEHVKTAEDEERGN